MSFQTSCGADFWLVKCLEVAIKGLGGTATICLSKQELLPCRRRGCLVRETFVMSTAFCLWCIPTLIHASSSPPQHTKNTVVFASLEKNATFWASKFECGKRTKKKVVLVLKKKKKKLCLLVANISLELYKVKSKSFSLRFLCVHLCPFPAFLIVWELDWQGVTVSWPWQEVKWPSTQVPQKWSTSSWETPSEVMVGRMGFWE